jgi:hypothetical protein
VRGGPKIVGAVFDRPRYNVQIYGVTTDAVFATIFRWMKGRATAGRPYKPACEY